MTTLREFIVDQSSLPAGNTIRDHLNNPNIGGDCVGGLIPIPYSEINVNDEVVKLTVSDYSESIEIVEVEPINITIIEDVTILSFEE